MVPALPRSLPWAGVVPGRRDHGVGSVAFLQRGELRNWVGVSRTEDGRAGPGGGLGPAGRGRFPAALCLGRAGCPVCRRRDAGRLQACPRKSHRPRRDAPSRLVRARTTGSRRWRHCLGDSCPGEPLATNIRVRRPLRETRL